ncbi:MAG: capsular biosynthesis protein [Pseudomonadota bacterium]
MPARLSVLFLQGPPTAFWPELATAFEAAGHRVSKVHFCLGDRMFWPRRGARDYRGALEAFERWLDALCTEQEVTDILYYADRHPYHIIAARIAERRGLRAWAVENGYLRPDWLTLEPFAMGRNSRFPSAPDEILRLAEGGVTPDWTPRYRHGFLREAASDMAFNLARIAGWPLYPRYRSDVYYPALLDYLCWVPSSLRKWRRRRACEAVEARCAEGLDFTLLAMQLQSDYQIRASSDYGHLSEMLEEVIASLASHAPDGRHLVVKSHPLDSGWENWPHVLAEIARSYGVADRVHWLDGGDLAALIDRAAGVLTVNSTVGLHALRQHRPVLCLGSAVYDIPGLTHQTGLDSFWTQPSGVDVDLLEALLIALERRIQVRGSFYDPDGRKAAQTAIVNRLEQPEVYWTGEFDR